jgi:hypothetical protein
MFSSDINTDVTRSEGKELPRVITLTRNDKLVILFLHGDEMIMTSRSIRFEAYIYVAISFQFEKV